MKPLYDFGWLLSRFVGTVLMGGRVSGQQNAPRQGGFILASNHISYLDPPLVGCYVRRRMHFFAKKELFAVPVLGWLVRNTQSHPVRRGGFDRQALETAVRLLKANKALTMFPEGTRGRDGEFLDPKAGIGRIAQEAGAPILPAYMENSDRFKRCLLRKDRLRIRYGELISDSWIGAQSPDKEGWQAVAREVMRRIGLLRDLEASGADEATQSTAETQKRYE
ncbi:MAG: lysophospholipid acyltransferase family protein [Candidatus Zixiibacteriota bacterium]